MSQTCSKPWTRGRKRYSSYRRCRRPDLGVSLIHLLYRPTWREGKLEMRSPAQLSVRDCDGSWQPFWNVIGLRRLRPAKGTVLDGNDRKAVLKLLEGRANLERVDTGQTSSTETPWQSMKRRFCVLIFRYQQLP
jgi:hypothetical protein